MSARAIAAAWSVAPALPPVGARLLLLRLAHASDNHGLARHLDWARVSRECGLSEADAEAALRELVEARLVAGDPLGNMTIDLERCADLADAHTTERRR